MPIRDNCVVGLRSLATHAPELASLFLTTQVGMFQQVWSKVQSGSDKRRMWAWLCTVSSAVQPLVVGPPLIHAGSAYSTVQPTSMSSTVENRPVSTSWRLYMPSMPEPLPIPPTAPVVAAEPPEPVMEELLLAGNIAPEDEAIVLEDALAAVLLKTLSTAGPCGMMVGSSALVGAHGKWELGAVLNEADRKLHRDGNLCFYCHIKGHSAKDCRKKAAARQGGGRLNQGGSGKDNFCARIKTLSADEKRELYEELTMEDF
ncbi:predicted protein [Postia placenta Mad-698-R]|nr:predicted protein [Postia placenta Mad-698-R]